MKTVIEMARSVGATAYTNRHYPNRPTHTFNVDQLEAFAEIVRADERNRWEHNYEVLMNALWKACGDDAKLVEETIKSQGELK